MMMDKNVAHMAQSEMHTKFWSNILKARESTRPYTEQIVDKQTQ
jgi:hypothetical protein